MPQSFGEATACWQATLCLRQHSKLFPVHQALPSRTPPPFVRWSRAAGANGMVWGQELDLAFEEKPATAEELREVHRNKTGMLINAAAQLGAVAASADDIQRQAIARYAFSVGLVFQIIDDILDVTATAQQSWANHWQRRGQWENDVCYIARRGTPAGLRRN